MLTNTQANAILDAFLGSGATLLPGTVYIGLLQGAPNADGSGVVEPVGNSYARVAVTNNTTQWPAAATRIKTHANDIVFPVATGSWGTITHFGIFDALSGGAIRIYDALDIPRAIVATDQFRFLAGTSPLKVTVP